MSHRLQWGWGGPSAPGPPHHSVGRSRPGWTLRREGGLQGGGGQLDTKEMVDKVYMAVQTVVFVNFLYIYVEFGQPAMR